MNDDERVERRIVWAMGGACLLTLAWILAIFGLVAWVIVRVTLHFT